MPPTSTRGKRTAVIFNPRAGSGLREIELRQALNAAQIEAFIHCIPAEGPVLQQVAELASEFDVLVAAGGDGTVSTVAAAAVRFGNAMGVIPSGTLNHFARDAAIPTELTEALQVVAAGYSRGLDVGMVNGLVFINNASIGAYPRMVWDRNRRRREGWPRLLSMALAVIGTWIDLRSLTVRLRADNVELIRRSPFVFVGNGAYDVEGMNFGRRPTLTDGTLSLYVAPDSGRLDALMMPLRALAGTLTAHDKFETWQATAISVGLAHRRIAVALDGEIHTLATPLNFTIRRAALRAIVPAPQADMP